MSLVMEGIEESFDMDPIRDLDLIEILWRQDIDLGAERDAYDVKQRKQQEKEVETEIQQQVEKEKELKQILAEEQNAQNNTQTISYIIDQETGEVIPAPVQTASVVSPTSHPVPAPDVLQEPQQVVQIQSNLQPEQQQTQQLSIEDAMRLLEESTGDFTFEPQSTTQNVTVQQELQELETMIDNVTQSFEQQPGFQRQSSLEQRWNDISLMLDTATNDTSFEQQSLIQNASLLQNTSFAPPALVNNISSVMEGFGSASYPPLASQPLTPINVTQPHLLPTDALGLNDTSLITHGGPGAFVNSSASLLQHLLNDNLDDLSFTDMNITNSTEAMETNDLYTDSAISSAGSLNSPRQTVSSIGSPTQDLSDFRSNISSPYDALEGATGGSTEGESPSYHSLKSEYKYDADQSYTDAGYASHDGRRLYSNSSDGSNTTDFSEHELPADPRKVNHNHTYPLQPGQEPKIHKKAFKQELDTTDIQYTRDQKRAKAMNIPFTMEDMITSTVETFNEMLQEHTLTESQLQLVRDIRRRGKNKVAAQNCRKRKLEVIQGLEEEVAKMRENRDKLQKERQMMDKDLAQMKQKYSHAYQEVFQSLRDEHDQPYDPNEFTLQQTDDGEMLLVPHNATSVINDEPKSKSNRKRKADRKH